ncbi:Myb domain protein 62 [Tanacetum coccineum]
MGNKASTSGMQEEVQSSTPLVEKINMFEKQLDEGCVLRDDDGKPLKNANYSGDHRMKLNMLIMKWINDTRYEAGVIEFLDFAYRVGDESLAIPCPCRSCNNFRDKNRVTMYKHLMQNGITRGYTTWNYHGEESEDDDRGGNDVPFDGSDGGTDDMSDDDLDEIHPADIEAWKHLGRIDPLFVSDPHNIRLGLATDGFNPFGNLSSSYNTWPVFIVPYNLPSWECMKYPYMFMSMLIPGPKSLLNIDVYLEPLIDELKDLWASVNAYDALRKEDFTLRAALLWTTNDFLTYGMLSGWSVKGYKACPTCMDETSSHYLKWGRKERGYLRFQDKESVIHENDVTMENLYREDHQEHEVNSPQTNTVNNAHHQQNIASNSNGTTITRKETRALSANRKSIFNQRKLVFEIDDCEGHIVGDDSQTFITKGGCVVRECAVFDGSTWKKQPDLLKEDIICKTMEHSDFKSTCPQMARAIKTQLASHHRTRQYILHKHYLRYPTKEEATTHPPNGVKFAEWVLLCDRKGKVKVVGERSYGIEGKSSQTTKGHVSFTKKVNYLLKHFTAWQSPENEDYDTEDYDEDQDDGM